jgi:hypothetical protein
LDLGKLKDAASTRKAIVWAIQEFHKLELKDALGFICYNISGNSGLGKTGGFVIQIVRKYKHLGVRMFRIPCTSHVLHIGWGNGRVELMGKLPSIKERWTVHPWNLYWLCYKEFGLQDPKSASLVPTVLPLFCHSVRGLDFDLL